MPQPGMPSVMDAINPPVSFSARKTQVSNVPVPGRIDLPVNPVTQKFSSALPQGSIGSLLTPPSNISGDSLSPLSSTASTAHNGPATQGLPPFTPNGSWTGPAGTGLTPILGSGSGNTSQSWGSTMPFPPPRSMFSPLGGLVGTSGSPVKSEALPPPPYNMNDLHALPTSNSHHVNMPQSSMAPHHNVLPSAQSMNHQQMSYMPMGPTPLTAGAVASLPSQQSPSENYMRAPPTPATSYYGSQASSTPLQSSFPFNPSSPPALSPPPRISPAQAGSNFPPPPPPLSGTTANQQYQPYGAVRPPHPFGNHMGMPPMHPYSQQPFNSGSTARLWGMEHPGAMLGAPQLAHNDRPFKCDQCPQSFNRNHDLKRHKRIHLAVKPFPCGWCDKSFSRKDALKRHILVKGCGKAMAGKDGEKVDVDDDSKSDSDGDADSGNAVS